MIILNLVLGIIEKGYMLKLIERKKSKGEDILAQMLIIHVMEGDS
jgi:hypothetical protein